VIDVRQVIAVGLVLVGIFDTAAAAGADAANETTFVGYAYDRKTDGLLYTEFHSERTRADGRVLAATYVSPNGEKIATYRAEFSGDSLVPEVRFEDLRRGTSEGVRIEDGTIVLYRERSASDERFDEKRPACADLPVADAGLNHLVNDHWDRLLDGERVVAELLIPQRLRCLRFSLVKTDEWSLDGEPVVTIDMAFTNPLIRLLAGPLRFIYHRDHRVVVRFEGKSRLVDESGDNYVVRVDFPIAERSERTAERRATRNGGSDG
jgi:hypothetical protein